MKIRKRNMQRAYLSRYAVTQQKIERRQHEGRGQGEGSLYIPWLKVFDVPSWGMSTRIVGSKTGRIHHLFSRLEFRYFLILEWALNVRDIREQFPLPLEATLEIAKSLGIAHPQDRRTKHPIVMTSDFNITVEKSGQHLTRIRHIKYKKDLTPRTLKKFEIDRLLWANRGEDDWAIVTEDQIPIALTYNIEWIYPCLHQAPSDLTLSDLQWIGNALTERVLEETLAIRHICKQVDHDLKLNPRTSISVVKYLIAKRYWEIDMHEKINTNHVLILQNRERF